jgi:hypothetical protein
LNSRLAGYDQKYLLRRMNLVSRLHRTSCLEEHRTNYPCADQTSRPRLIQLNRPGFAGGQLV